MFAHASAGQAMDVADFFSAIASFDSLCGTLLAAVPPLRDLGCHNPAFPAPYDRVVRLATRAIAFVMENDAALLTTPVSRTVDAG